MRFGHTRSFPNASRAKRFFHRCIHSMKLMIARHLLRDGRTVIFKDEKVPGKIEKSPLIKRAAHEDFESWNRCRCDCFAFDCAPRHEPFTVRANRSDARFQPV